VPTRPLLALLGALALLGGCRADGGAGRAGGFLQPGREVAAEQGERAVRLGDRTLVLNTPAGHVRVVGADTEEVRVRYEREARGATAASASERLARVRLEEAQSGELVQFVADTDGLEGASVRLEAEVPRGAALVVQVGQGEVTLSGVEGDVVVEVRRGGIGAAGLSGRHVRLTTRTGDIAAAFVAVPEGADLRVGTGRGDVGVALPAGASLAVTAEAGAGRVVVEGLPFEGEQREQGPGLTRLLGRLGEGRARLRAESDEGTVRLWGAAGGGR